jgi:hypothetical protein
MEGHVLWDTGDIVGKLARRIFSVVDIMEVLQQQSEARSSENTEGVIWELACFMDLCNVTVASLKQHRQALCIIKDQGSSDSKRSECNLLAPFPLPLTYLNTTIKWK